LKIPAIQFFIKQNQQYKSQLSLPVFHRVYPFEKMSPINGLAVTKIFLFFNFFFANKIKTKGRMFMRPYNTN